MAIRGLESEEVRAQTDLIRGLEGWGLPIAVPASVEGGDRDHDRAGDRIVAPDEIGRPAPSTIDRPIRVCFVLPSRGRGGGTHAVIQEVIELRRVGVDAFVATLPQAVSAFATAYPSIDDLEATVRPYSDAIELAALVRPMDVVVGTVCTTIRVIREALEGVSPAPGIAYYVQDYEPLFWPPRTPAWQEAFDSYTLLPGMKPFARTDWLCDTVAANHRVAVRKISASVDHDVYHADASRRRGDRFVVAGMIRPPTRRAPRRTARILSWLATNEAAAYEVHAFGEHRDELAADDIHVDASVEVHGRLSREEVAALLRRCDAFLDASDYQAFGRTGIEAMASGCVPIAPVRGGAVEYLEHGVNGLLVDTISDEAIQGAVRQLAEMDRGEFAQLRSAALATAARYSTARTAAEELAMFGEMISSRA
jgi:glycosyltransferase involved in cell wall biosynthesis